MRTVIRVLAVVALLAVGGCSGGGDDSSSGSTQEMAPEYGTDGGAADESVDVVGPGAVTPDTDRQVVVSGSVSLQVDDPTAAAQDVAELVEAVGGYVAERVEQTAREGTDASAYLVVRIPAAEVTTTLEQLGRLGTVVDTSLMRTEVTAQARDLDARIRALEISVARLEDLLGRAGTIADVVAAEQVLTDRQAELESLQSQRAALADQVEMSTIRLDLWTEAAVPDEPPTGFFAGLATGWKALVSAAVGALTVLGVLLPWLGVAALVAAVVVVLHRWWVRRRPAPTPDATFTAPTRPSGPTTTLPSPPS